MKKITNWPTLENEGGWRRIANSPRMFPTLFRFHRGKAQTISFNFQTRLWELDQQNDIIAGGDLEFCLLSADQ